MDLFSNYEQDFHDVYSSVQNRIRSIPSLTGNAKQDCIRAAQSEIKDAEEILQSMNLSARTVTGNSRQQLQQKLQQYESDLATIKKSLRSAQTKIAELQDRESLLGSDDGTGGGGIVLHDTGLNSDQRDKVARDTERMQKGSSALKQALITAEETVDVGGKTLEELGRQREMMERQSSRLDEINEKLGVAGKIIQGMARRVVTNKIIMSIIILVMIAAIILIVWVKFGGKHNNNTTSTTTTTTGDYSTTTADFSTTTTSITTGSTTM
eukprot:TRINITY_DN1698_c0_g1_i13.p1 TRINITY_DN1698_c0_g1~~TRINITY_DN1698_c0_g1_i13.p1  ORF type:complete len:267 (+),score=60.22 TRINITY_DN1698_c0_g1_i13:264-1064(+)